MREKSAQINQYNIHKELVIGATCKMVAKSAALREFLTLDAASERSSVYVNPDREKYFELPVFFESDDDLTTCFNVLAQGRERDWKSNAERESFRIFNPPLTSREKRHANKFHI